MLITGGRMKIPNDDENVGASNKGVSGHHKTKHHIIPTSRGGSKADSWNYKMVDKKKHNALHTLFANLTPPEMEFLIRYYWSDNSRKLKDELLGPDQLRAWYILFKNNCTDNAIRVINQEWSLTAEGEIAMKEWLKKRKKDNVSLMKKIANEFNKKEVNKDESD